MDRQKMIIIQLERQFDDAFKSLLDKIYQHQEVGDNFKPDYEKTELEEYEDEDEEAEEEEEEGQEKEEEENQEETQNDEEKDDGDSPATSSSTNGSEQEYDSGPSKPYSGVEDDDDDREEDSSAEQSLSTTMSNEGAFCMESVEPELIQMAVAHAKLMTKAFLFGELNNDYEQRISKLEKENFHLKQKLKNQTSSLPSHSSRLWERNGCCRCNTIDGDGVFSAPSLDNESDVKDSSNRNGGSPSITTTEEVDIRKKKTKISKNVTNLILLKNALKQEINNQEWLIERQYLKKISMLKFFYKNKICGLNLVIGYLKKELAGRVQQLQLLNKDVVDSLNLNGSYCQECDAEPSSPPTMMIIRNEQFIKIWNQIIYEILLNRFKTLIRVAEVSEQMDKCSNNNSVDYYTSDDEELYDQNTLIQHIQSILSSGGSDQCLPLKTKNSEQMINFERMGRVRFITIHLDHPNQSLGLEICGGYDDQTPMFIWKVEPDSPAGKNGGFCPGDLILSIQSQDMIGKSQKDAAVIIKEVAKNDGWCRLGILRIPLKNFVEQNFDFELLHDDNFEIQMPQRD